MAPSTFFYWLWHALIGVDVQLFSSAHALWGTHPARDLLPAHGEVELGRHVRIVGLGEAARAQAVPLRVVVVHQLWDGPGTHGEHRPLGSSNHCSDLPLPASRSAPDRRPPGVPGGAAAYLLEAAAARKACPDWAKNWAQKRCHRGHAALGRQERVGGSQVQPEWHSMRGSHRSIPADVIRHVAPHGREVFSPPSPALLISPRARSPVQGPGLRRRLLRQAVMPVQAASP